MDATGDNAPIRIKSGAFGNTAKVWVSPQHRVLVSGWRAQLFFGEDEILVPAKHLVNDTTVIREPMREVTYCHLMLDGHEVLQSSGLRSESLVPRFDLVGLGRAHVRDILSLEQRATKPIPLARPVIRGSQVRAAFAPFRDYIRLNFGQMLFPRSDQFPQYG